MAVHSSAGGPMKIFWGQAPGSLDRAVDAAVQAAQDELAGHTLEWLEVIEFRGGFEGGEVQYQAAIRVGYSSQLSEVGLEGS